MILPKSPLTTYATWALSRPDQMYGRTASRDFRRSTLTNADFPFFISFSRPPPAQPWRDGGRSRTSTVTTEGGRRDYWRRFLQSHPFQIWFRARVTPAQVVEGSLYAPPPPPPSCLVSGFPALREIMSAWLRLSSFPSTKLEHGKTMNRLRIIKSTEGRPDKQSIDHSRPRLLLKKDFGPQEENYFFLFIERSKLFLRRPRKNSQEKC